MLITYSLLTLALIALWIPAQPKRWLHRLEMWHLFYGAAVVCGVVFDYVHMLGLFFILLFALSCIGVRRKSLPAGLWVMASIGLSVLAVGFFLHRVPGFSNPKVMADVLFSPDALPYTRFLNFDKATVGLFLIGFTLQRLSNLRSWRIMLHRTVFLGGATILLLMGMSGVLGYVRFDPKWTPLFGLWAWSNLFLTCIAEEAFFRGVVQCALVHLLAQYRYGAAIGVIIAAGVFGLAHLAGGWTYAMLAMIAGLSYGLAYQRTGAIEAAILVHFGLNTAHFLFFTYPALASIV